MSSVFGSQVRGEAEESQAMSFMTTCQEMRAAAMNRATQATLHPQVIRLSARP
jgi:hypothetical protein